MFKLNNKGFSGKEFFLVFVAVAVIIMGIMPIIFRVIDKSKYTQVTDSVMVFRNEVNKEIISYVNGGNEVNDGCYIITKDGNLCIGDTNKDGECSKSLIIDITGLKPDGGSVNIKENKVSNLYNILIDNKYVNFEDDQYYISDKPNMKMICE